MTNGAVLQMLVSITEENAKYESALRLLKHRRDVQKGKNMNVVLTLAEADEVLAIAGMTEKQGIPYDNDSEIAYVPRD